MVNPTSLNEELAAQLASLTSERDQALGQRDEAMSDRDAALSELNEALLKIKLLSQKLDALAQRLFGKKSEQLNQAQLLLLLQEHTAPGPALGKESGPEDLEALAPRPKRDKKRRERRMRTPADLPVIEEILDPAPVKACPEAWRYIGEEVSELLDYEPGRFLRRRLVRRKYVKRADVDATPIIAKLPGMILERGIVGPGLLAHIVVSKYCDHLPLYRLESIFESRHDVWLPRQTMSRWMGVAADWLGLIYKAIRAEVTADGYVQVDETAIEYLAPGNGKTKKGYLWACSKPGGDVVFYWNTSRAATCLEDIIPADFEGVIQCDGYSAYDCFARRRKENAHKNIILTGCMAHVRRNFFEAREESPRTGGFFLAGFRELYAIETKLREQKADADLRKATRQSESRPVMERLHAELLELSAKRRFLPAGGMGQAISYALGEWPSLDVFIRDGRVEMDNNLIENSIRPTAIGKKNWLFFGDADAGERSAILYTITESCRRRGIDANAYLRDMFARLPSMTNQQIAEVTPEAWARSRAEVALASAA